jgi:hypothetical protein
VIKIREEKEIETTIVPTINIDEEPEGNDTREEIEEGESITQRVLEGQESNYFPL